MKKKLANSSGPGYIVASSHGADELGGSKRMEPLLWLERLALPFERVFTWLGGSANLNPFYHTGTLAVFLWMIVALSGLYLTLFYQFGFEASYRSVSKMEGQLLAHVIRAIHRYASGSAMVVSLLHGFRLLFMDRFRGARWLAWVSGVVMALFLWLDGLTGYWLVWDQRAQLITNSFTALLERTTSLAPAFVSSMLKLEATDMSWIFIVSVLSIHVLLFGGVALFFWWHIMRLSRPKFLPSRYWLLGVGVVVLMVSAAFPVGMLPRADFRQLPAAISLDPFYLFYLPLSFGPGLAWLWAGLAAVFIVAGAIPWLSLQPMPESIKIDQGCCTGCRACASDCPYKAISMMNRDGDDSHGRKFVAVVDPRLCVACGVCLGSCDTGCISMGEISEDLLWRRVETRIVAHARKNEEPVTLVFTCERHASQGARPYLDQAVLSADQHPIEVLALPCVAAVSPILVSRALAAGAGQIRVVGCPPDDCARREGNLWAEGRLNRTRLPRLKKAYENAPISTFWLAPDAFSQSLPVLATASSGLPRLLPALVFPEKTAADRSSLTAPVLAWRNFVPVFVVIGLLMALQVWASRTWVFQPYPVQEARLQLVIPDPLQLGYAADRFIEKYGDLPTRLVLSDGERSLFEEIYPFSEDDRKSPQVAESIISTGEHHFYLRLVGNPKNNYQLSLYDRTVSINAGQVWIIQVEPISGPD
ncbi:MAG: hydrogenase iron-sulfur subunit [Chloroflexi bacterium]|nr:hydrogenase iron-sulfur subunit [Chloroflexota bacterium]